MSKYNRIKSIKIETLTKEEFKKWMEEANERISGEESIEDFYDWAIGDEEKQIK